MDLMLLEICTNIKKANFFLDNNFICKNVHVIGKFKFLNDLDLRCIGNGSKHLFNLNFLENVKSLKRLTLFFYDLENETITNLLVVPFQVMDGTLLHYLKLSPENAFTEVLSQ